MARILGSGITRGKRDKGKSSMKLPYAASTLSIVSPASTAPGKRHQNISSSNLHLNVFFETLSNNATENERFVLQKIDEAWKLKDTDSMFRLITENEFSDLTKKSLVKLWDAGHYYKAEMESGKPLTPLSRFRIRERNVPPKSICPNGRLKATLPRRSTQVLRNWLESSPSPYPTRENKEALAKLTGLSVMQVNTWFANTRRRMNGKRKPKRDGNKGKQNALKWTSSQTWPTISPPTMTSASIFAPRSSQVCACPGSALSQILAQPSLGATLPSSLWPAEQLNSTAPTTYLEWPTSHSATLGSQYFSPASVMALTAPNFWRPEFPYCGLHAAAQILMDMASK
ncbi:homeobox protein SIX1-like [Montipora capricornis]|uniref:homeobox protein SIX1-like n=1 Tax=Montipora capricornis TaxID=246305 RepID=UPI0035F1EA85